MREREPMIQTMELSDGKNRLSSLVDAVSRRETRILVEESGVPVAARVPAADLERLARLDRERAERTAALERFGAAFAKVPTAELEDRVARIVAEGPEPEAAAPERRPA